VLVTNEFIRMGKYPLMSCTLFVGRQQALVAVPVPTHAGLTLMQQCLNGDIIDRRVVGNGVVQGAEGLTNQAQILCLR